MCCQHNLMMLRLLLFLLILLYNKMSSFWNFAFGALLVIIWIVAGGFITKTNVLLGPYKNDDDNFNNAYWYSFWAAFVTWTLIGIFIILVILSVIGVIALFGSGVGEAGAVAEGGIAATEGAETVTLAGVGKKSASSKEGKGAISTGISWLTIGFLIFALILVGITGILSALTASSMVKSTNYDPSNDKLKNAYNNAIIAASLCLGAGGLLIIGIIAYFIVGEQRKRKIKAQKELAAKERELELHELQQLKTQSVQQKAAQQAAFTQQLHQTALAQKVYQAVGTTPVPQS